MRWRKNSYVARSESLKKACGSNRSYPVSVSVRALQPVESVLRTGRKVMAPKHTKRFSWLPTHPCSCTYGPPELTRDNSGGVPLDISYWHRRWRWLAL